MNPTIKKVIFVIILMVAIIASIVIGGVLVSKITCKHDNKYELEELEYQYATCQSTGLTNGLKCNYCGKILIEQKIIDKIECKESSWIIDKEPTNTEDGIKHTECEMCGKIFKQEVVSAGTQGFEYEENNDGTYTLKNDNNVSCDEIVIPKTYSGQKVTNIGSNAFTGNYAISIKIPNTVTTIQGYAFSSCRKIKQMVIPESVISIGNYCFMNCEKLESIVFLNDNTQLNHAMFWGCKSLKEITLPRNITTIYSNMFYKCTSLTTITIPKNVMVIGNDAFCSCTSLETIRFEGTVEQWNRITFGVGWRAYVPATEVICSNGVVKF